MSTYPPNQTTPKSGNYLWNWLGSPLKKFAAALSPYMGGGDVGYKKYVALLRQTGIDPPVATVLENTIGGNPTWSRLNDGEYNLTFDSPFDLDKTFCSATLSYNQDAYFTYIDVIDAIPFNIIEFWTYNQSTSVDMNSGIFDVGAFIEIRVYP